MAIDLIRKEAKEKTVEEIQAEGPDSEVLIHTGLGHGSTATKIRTWVAANVTTVGSDITYVSDTLDGDYFLINRSGVYSMSFADRDGGTYVVFGFSVNPNGTDRTTDINAVAVPTRLLYKEGSVVTRVETISTTVKLSAGDKVYAHDNGGGDLSDDRALFRITQVAKV